MIPKRFGVFPRENSTKNHIMDAVKVLNGRLDFTSKRHCLQKLRKLFGSNDSAKARITER